MKILKHEISGEDMHDLIHAIEQAQKFLSIAEKVIDKISVYAK